MIQPIFWSNGTVQLLDQRRLPQEEHYNRYTTWQEIATAIRDMEIRGAPAIGIAAAYALALWEKSPSGSFDEAAEALRLTRPTAVNLFWALSRMRRCYEQGGSLYAEAVCIHDEDAAACRRIGEQGADLIRDGMTILTHCNAGALATGGIGTALGPLRVAHERGVKFRVFADETRPYLQGARLTAWELHKVGIHVEILSDNMAGYFFSRGEIDLVFVGADRIAANGDVANKIGTYPVAVLAREHGAPFYVAAPTSTLDLSLASGREIVIEERSSEEVTSYQGVQLAPKGVRARHPAFDVTPSRLVSGIITEKLLARAPYEESLAAALAGKVQG
jgi:methylthioribose-1-phosphate isomerase